MAPPRPLKRQKTNPTQEQRPEPSTATQPPTKEQHENSQQTSQETSQAQEDTSTHAGPTSPTSTANILDSASQSWYSRTWPRKTAPVTQVARESISSAGSAAAEFASVVKDKVTERKGSTRSPSLAMTLGKSKSHRSLPVDATTTVVHATPDPTSPTRRKSSVPKPIVAEAGGLTIPTRKDSSALKSIAAEVKDVNATTKEEDVPAQSQDISKATDTPATLANISNNPQLSQEIARDKPDQHQNPGWFAWLARGSEPSQIASTSMVENQAESVSQNTSTLAEPNTNQSQLETAEQPNNKRSWLQMWSGSTPDRPSTPTSKDIDHAHAEQSQKAIENVNVQNTKASEQQASSSRASSIETSLPPTLPGDATKSSAWVFWSREKKGPQVPSSEGQPHVGEIAISDSPSQERPKRASISVTDKDRPASTKPNKQVEAVKNASSPRPESVKSVDSASKMDVKVEKKSHAKQDSTTTIKAESSNAVATVQEPAEASISRTASPAPPKKITDNLLLPSLTEVLSHPDHPSLLQQLARLLYYTKEPELKHLHLIKDPPRIKNALAIGVHGYFPTSLIRTVIGQPTGTSIKFADMAAKSIRKWTRAHGYDCQVKTAALEGEGKIAERVELLWRLLLNWLDEIRKSDFVMVACHSQGVPVAIMLVAKLIQFGCVSAARIGICAMAGVNMGPFPEFKSRWISGSAGELFEFSNPDSKVSRDYQTALELVLKSGVRLSLIGSIDDQLVSLESSIFSPITHPHIYRAVSIDSRVHAPNFISHLVGFVLKLRNLGIPDHGLIRELSSPLAGSLYTGEGHSRIYEDDQVYDLAVAFALQTNALPDTPVHRRPVTSFGAGGAASAATAGNNPYILPFAMRGILEEDFVKTDLQDEAAELLRQFDEWKPVTKVLKDVKFRLEGIRSRM